MTSGREIVTLQFGTYSNFVGAHCWNIQESGFDYTATSPSEINHSVLYREGVTNHGHVTFTPRLLAVDLKGSLHSLPKEGDLYGKPSLPRYNQALWPEDKVDIIQEPPATKNDFLEHIDAETMDGKNNDSLQDFDDLENSVEVWSDFLHARYHPSTVNIINEYQHGSSVKPFDIFNLGSHIWRTTQFEDDFTDRLRKFVEECDNMQGFHVLVDGTDGFAGLGSSALQYLQDEYSNKSVLVFPTIQSAYTCSTPIMDCVRTINLSLLFPKLAEHSSLFVPLSVSSHGWRHPGPPRQFPHLTFKNSLPYHTSAILGAAIETISLNYRLRNGNSLSAMCENLSKLGRRAAAASISLPFPLMDNAYLLETLEQWEGPLWQSLTPTCSLNDDRIWIQYIILRGVLQERLRSPNRIYQERNPAYTCSNVQEMLSLFLSCCSYATSSQVTTANTPCKVVRPFPQFFSEHVLQNGSLSDTPRIQSKDVTSVPVIAGIHSSRSVGNMLESLHSEVTKLNIRRFHQFTSAGLESDEYSINLEKLLELAECYHEEFNV